jgi:hypothetical protein
MQLPFSIGVYNDHFSSYIQLAAEEHDNRNQFVIACWLFYLVHKYFSRTLAVSLFGIQLICNGTYPAVQNLSQTIQTSQFHSSRLYTPTIK